MSPALLYIGLGLCFEIAVTPPVWHLDYEAAWDRAGELQVPMAIVIASGTGGWKEICSDAEQSELLVKLLTENYVCFYLDRSDPRNVKLAKDFGAPSEPTLIISDAARGYEEFRQVGAISTGKLSQILLKFAVPVAPPPPPLAYEVFPVTVRGVVQNRRASVRPYCPP